VAMHKAESPCAVEQWQDSLTNQMATEYLDLIDKIFPCAVGQWQDSLTNQMVIEYLDLIDKNFPSAVEQWQDSLTNQMATEYMYLDLIDKNFNSLNSTSVHRSSKSNGHVCNDVH